MKGNAGIEYFSINSNIQKKNLIPDEINSTLFFTEIDLPIRILSDENRFVAKSKYLHQLFF